MKVEYQYSNVEKQSNSELELMSANKTWFWQKIQSRTDFHFIFIGQFIHVEYFFYILY